MQTEFCNKCEFIPQPQTLAILSYIVIPRPKINNELVTAIVLKLFTSQKYFVVNGGGIVFYIIQLQSLF